MAAAVDERDETRLGIERELDMERLDGGVGEPAGALT